MAQPKTLPSKIKAQNEFEIVFHQSLVPLLLLVCNLVTEYFVCCSVVFFSFHFLRINIKNALCSRVPFTRVNIETHTSTMCIAKHFAYMKNDLLFLVVNSSFFLASRSVISILCHWKRVITRNSLFSLDYVGCRFLFPSLRIHPSHFTLALSDLEGKLRER